MARHPKDRVARYRQQAVEERAVAASLEGSPSVIVLDIAAVSDRLADQEESRPSQRDDVSGRFRYPLSSRTTKRPAGRSGKERLLRSVQQVIDVWNRAWLGWVAWVLGSKTRRHRQVGQFDH